MNERSKYTLNLIGLRIFLFSVIFSNVFDLSTAEDDLLINVTRNSDYVRPEQTLLRVFVKSFDPADVQTVSVECRRDSALYRTALLKYKPWALQMYDSSTKIPSALISGNYDQLGNYDECLRVRSDYDFVGKACRVKVKFSIVESIKTDEFDNNEPDMLKDFLVNVILASQGVKNWNISESDPYGWLWCVPSSCSARDVEDTIEFALNPLRRSSEVNFTVTIGNDSCHTEDTDRVSFDVADWIYIALLIIFGIVVVASTSYDLVHQRNPENRIVKDKKHKILISFSAYTNGKSLFALKRSADSIDCLDGIRFISICWIIYAHCSHLQLTGVQLELTNYSNMYERVDTFFYLNNNISTDTFFLLSALLLAYSEMRRKIKNPDSYKLNIWKLYIYRYLRLTPSYAMVIGFIGTLLYKTGSGPLWDGLVGGHRDFCTENWWTNLLYINNYINIWSMCLPQSWYVAVDMQLLWLSPIFLYPMLGNGRKYQKIFSGLLVLGSIVSILIPFFVTYCQRLTGTMIYYKTNPIGTAAQKDVHTQIYTRVYTRCSSYFIGLGLGYLFAMYDRKKTAMPTTIIIVGWMLAVAAGLAVLFGARELYLPEHKYDVVEAAFYAGFHRIVWASAVGWVIVASVFGWAGPVGSLLSWSMWAPFSRLTYSAYLTHLIIVWHECGSRRTAANFTIFGSIESLCGIVIMTLLISTVLYLCVEMPFCRLSQLLFQDAGPLTSTSANCNLPKVSLREIQLTNIDCYRPGDVNLSYLSNPLELIDQSPVISRTSIQESNSFAFIDSINDFSSIHNGKKDHVADKDFETDENFGAKETEPTSLADN